MNILTQIINLLLKNNVMSIKDLELELYRNGFRVRESILSGYMRCLKDLGCVKRLNRGFIPLKDRCEKLLEFIKEVDRDE